MQMARRLVVRLNCVTTADVSGLADAITVLSHAEFCGLLPCRSWPPLLAGSPILVSLQTCRLAESRVEVARYRVGALIITPAEASDSALGRDNLHETSLSAWPGSYCNEQQRLEAGDNAGVGNSVREGTAGVSHSISSVQSALTTTSSTIPLKTSICRRHDDATFERPRPEDVIEDRRVLEGPKRLEKIGSFRTPL